VAAPRAMMITRGWELVEDPAAAVVPAAMVAVEAVGPPLVFYVVRAVVSGLQIQSSPLATVGRAGRLPE